MEFKTINELLEYTQEIIGKSLNDVIQDDENLLLNQEMKKRKGILGDLIESEFYKYPNNNLAKADFDKLGVELKTTGIIKNSNGLRAKERLVLSMINYMDIINEDFDDSHLVQKNKLILILWYCYQKNVDFRSFKFVSLLLFSLYKDEDVIRNDFNIIKNKIVSGKAHELSEGDTTYLGACMKGRNSKDTRKQPYSDIPAPSRAFCLKNRYMTHLLHEMMENNRIKLEKTEHKYLSVVDYVKEKLNPYIDKNQLEIANSIDININKNKIAKNLNKLISNKVIGKDTELKGVDDIFKYSRYIIKNSPIVKYKGFKERMSFRNLLISDFNEKWNESLWKAYFEEISIINIFYEFENSTDKNGSGILKDVKLLTFNAEDIDAMKNTYDMVKNAIKEYDNRTYGNDLNQYVKLLPTPKSFDNQILEVLPKATKGKNSYYSLFENDKDRTNVAFALNKEFLNRKLELYLD